MPSFDNHLVIAEKCAEAALRKGAFAFGTVFEVQFDQKYVHFHHKDNSIESILGHYNDRAWIKFEEGL